MKTHRPQISEPAERAPQKQQACFRLLSRRKMVELWRSNRSQQNGIGRETGIKCGSRHWRSSSLDCLAAVRVLLEIKVMAVSAGDLAQDTHGLFSYFPPYTVTRKHHYIKIHGLLETPSSGSIGRS